MSTISSASPHSKNTTHQEFGWYPSDVDDKLLFLIRNVNLGVIVLGLVIGTVAVVSSLKSLSELTQSPKEAALRNLHKNDSWIVHNLKSKYAPPLAICGNGTISLFLAVLWIMLYCNVGGKAACDNIQPVLAFLYVISLWTTYVLFEIRRISAGTESFKGSKYWIMQGVRFTTMCMPIVSTMAYFTTSGIYLADVQHCILVFNPTIAWLFGIADGMLSTGHIMVFIFAIRQKSNFKLAAVAGRRNKIHPSTASPTASPSSSARYTRYTPTPQGMTQHSRGSVQNLLNRDLAASKDDAANKLRAISRRNLRLALITVASTAITMVILSSATLSSPPPGSSESRSYYYLAHLSQGACFADTLVNSLSVLFMTSSWQSARLKKFSSRFGSVRQMPLSVESDVSTLGGGTYL